MTISSTARSALALGTRPAGSPIGTKISTPTIYAIGDSNLYDTGFSLDATGRAWRTRLHEKLVASGITPTWVGNLVTGTAPADHHRGVAGSTMATHRAGQPADSVTYVAALAPDVVILALGTNDVASDAGRDDYVTNCTGLVADIMAARPATNRFVLCKMYNLADPTSQARMDVINNTHVATAKAAIEGAGGLVVVADLRVVNVKGHLRQSEGASAKHIQTQDGYELVASALFPAVVNACGYDAVWVGDMVS